MNSFIQPPQGLPVLAVQGGHGAMVPQNGKGPGTCGVITMDKPNIEIITGNIRVFIDMGLVLSR